MSAMHASDDATVEGERVILLHGLWMRAFTLIPLRRRLERAGYQVDLFDYASVFRDPQSSVQALLDKLSATAAGKVHCVGHSLVDRVGRFGQQVRLQSTARAAVVVQDERAVRIADLEVRELTTVEGRHYAGLVHAAVHHAMKAARRWSSGRIGRCGSGTAPRGSV